MEKDADMIELYRNVSIAKFEGYTQPEVAAKFYAFQLYRNVSIAKFEGYTQLRISYPKTDVCCIGMYQLQNLKDIHNHHHPVPIADRVV